MWGSNVSETQTRGRAAATACSAIPNAQSRQNARGHSIFSNSSGWIEGTFRRPKPSSLSFLDVRGGAMQVLRVPIFFLRVITRFGSPKLVEAL